MCWIKDFNQLVIASEYTHNVPIGSETDDEKKERENEFRKMKARWSK